MTGLHAKMEALRIALNRAEWSSVAARDLLAEYDRPASERAREWRERYVEAEQGPYPLTQMGALLDEAERAITHLGAAADSRHDWPPMASGKRKDEPDRRGLPWLGWFAGMVWRHGNPPPADAQLAMETVADVARDYKELQTSCAELHDALRMGAGDDRADQGEVERRCPKHGAPEVYTAFECGCPRDGLVGLAAAVDDRDALRAEVERLRKELDDARHRMQVDDEVYRRQLRELAEAKATSGELEKARRTIDTLVAALAKGAG